MAFDLEWDLSQLEKTKEEVNLSLLEEKLYILQYTAKHSKAIGRSWFGPVLKTHSSYMINEGYSLGSIAWYVHIAIDGFNFMVFGKTPEDSVDKAILVFQECKNLSAKDFDKWLDNWLSQEKEKSSEIARWA
jgi:hypothetical protein